MCVRELEGEIERDKERQRVRGRDRETEREKQGRGNDSCHFSDQDFLPCYLCKYPNILFLNNNVIFQQKNLPINSGNLVGIG